MSTRSLKHRHQTSCSMVPQIQLLFSIPQTIHPLVFRISVSSLLPTQLPEEKPGYPSLCCSFSFFISNQPCPVPYIPVTCPYYQYLPSTLSTLAITNFMQDVIFPPEDGNQVQPRSSCYFVSFSLLWKTIYHQNESLLLKAGRIDI